MRLVLPKGSGAACPGYFDTLSPTASPTALPTNIGDTHTPTALPTAAPTFDFNNILNWAEMKSACGSIPTSGTVTLSDDFIMGTYTTGSEIDFSGKQLVIIGNNKVLNAGEGG